VSYDIHLLRFADGEPQPRRADRLHELLEGAADAPPDEHGYSRVCWKGGEADLYGMTTSAARIKVEAIGNVFFDVNDADLALQTAPTTTPGGTVPATLTLTLGSPAQFGAFTPGITRTYLASTNANVISTAGDALLSVSDPSSVGTGHLVNGTFVLPEPLQARARNAANTGTAFNNVGSSASPLNLLTWSAPISNDAVTLEFSQLVKSTDPLRTGTYSKPLTFTLSTATP
jgi:hypothetical protein